MWVCFTILVVSACSPSGTASSPTSSTPIPSNPAEAATPPKIATLVNTEPAATLTPGPAETEQPSDTTPSDAYTPLQGPLSVIITSPEDGAEVQTNRVTLEGEADPETVINIDDQLIVVDAGRKFTTPLTLQEGPNIIEITASDPDGSQGTSYLTLTYDPQP